MKARGNRSFLCIFTLSLSPPDDDSRLSPTPLIYLFNYSILAPSIHHRKNARMHAGSTWLQLDGEVVPHQRPMLVEVHRGLCRVLVPPRVDPRGGSEGYRTI